MTKKIISLLLILTALIFSACSSNIKEFSESEPLIVGDWYNSNGHHMQILPDNTYSINIFQDFEFLTGHEVGTLCPLQEDNKFEFTSDNTYNIDITTDSSVSFITHPEYGKFYKASTESNWYIAKEIYSNQSFAEYKGHNLPIRTSAMTCEYDEFNRLTAEIMSDNHIVYTYSSDQNGSIGIGTEVSTGEVLAKVYYNFDNRLMKKEELSYGTVLHTSEYTYHANGKAKTHTMTSSLGTIHYDFDTRGNVLLIKYEYLSGYEESYTYTYDRNRFSSCKLVTADYISEEVITETDEEHNTITTVMIRTYTNDVDDGSQTILAGTEVTEGYFQYKYDSYNNLIELVSQNDGVDTLIKKNIWTVSPKTE